MSHFNLHGIASKAGLLAPHIDRPAPPATPRLALHRWNRFSRHKFTNEGLPPLAVAAPRRRPSQVSGGAAAGGNIGSGRADQLYDLDREGAYGTTATASQPGSAAASIKADGGGGNSNSAFLDDGWGVAAVGASANAAAKPTARRDKKKQKKQLAAAVASGAGSAQKPVPTPFFDKSSEAGLAGLTLLQARLVEEGIIAHGPERKAAAAAEAAARRERQAKSVRRRRDWVDPDELDVGEGEAEEVSLEQNEQQYFELNLEADGSTEVVEFDEKGRIRARRAPGASAPAAAGSHRRRGSNRHDDEDDDPLAFLADDDDDNDDDEVDVSGINEEKDVGEVYERRAASGAAAGPSRRGMAATAAPGRGGLYDSDEGDHDREAGAVRRRPMPGQDPLADEEIEWGLDELRPVGRPSLMRELGVIKKKKTPKTNAPPQQQQQQQDQPLSPLQSSAKEKAGGSVVGTSKPDAVSATATPPSYDEDDEDEYDEERDVSVAWGGSGGASGIDMDQQEALLSRLFKPHKVKELMAHQRAAEAELAAMKRKASGRQVLESKVHSRMRIIAGSAAGRQLASSQGATTRPMMEKVRQAIFNMVQAQAGSGVGLPETARWLDFFAGTGSVGLEALSRGCRECHFIELDSWVCRKVLSRNISSCGFQRRSVIHTMKAEDFLRKSIDLPRFAGGPFDFVSVCPPYLVVSYPELMDLLERSPLLHERSIVFVEYPKQLAHQVPPTLKSLVTVRDRKYGRTFIRVYGPPGGPADIGEAGDDGFASVHGGSSAEEDSGDELLLM
ncbi:hypothetical protein Vretimale_15973 [Volvox reticuliferus]|uniref:Uncharacterized protein n=1 Tax=Volvox reticuliferus TaxID=1737510 RepID=A0A8J4CM44_9CHLO|nr:hypothetical protein Vretifemale_13039 [Volvox reticuliferus]GIM12671.1 hypothetical protein Vretimale_15973 [Volvox reticuliferus]